MKDGVHIVRKGRCHGGEATLVLYEREYEEGEEVIYDDDLARRYAHYVIRRIKKRI